MAERKESMLFEFIYQHWFYLIAFTIFPLMTFTNKIKSKFSVKGHFLIKKNISHWEQYATKVFKCTAIFLSWQLSNVPPAFLFVVYLVTYLTRGTQWNRFLYQSATLGVSLTRVWMIFRFQPGYWIPVTRKMKCDSWWRCNKCLSNLSRTRLKRTVAKRFGLTM